MKIEIDPNAFEDTAVDEASVDPRGATEEMPDLPLRAALPFRAQPRAPQPPPSSSGDTIDLGELFPGAALPFPSPSPASAGVPRRRLVRFDPQTGQALPEPRWETVWDPPPRR